MQKFVVAAALAASALTPVTAVADAGDFIIRGRVIGVLPTEETSGIEPAVPTGSVEVENAFVPEIDFTYFFTDHLAAELILATSPHDLQGTGAVSGLGKVADVWVLPPTLTLQYHFAPEASLRPYVGVGVNYTIFYAEETTGSLNDALGDTTLELDDSLGVAFQLGADIDVSENWFFNMDAKYIQIDTDALLRTGSAANKIAVDLDPIVVGLGFGRRF